MSYARVICKKKCKYIKCVRLGNRKKKVVQYKLNCKSVPLNLLHVCYVLCGSRSASESDVTKERHYDTL